MKRALLVPQSCLGIVFKTDTTVGVRSNRTYSHPHGDDSDKNLNVTNTEIFVGAAGAKGRLSVQPWPTQTL